MPSFVCHEFPPLLSICTSSSHKRLILTEIFSGFSHIHGHHDSSSHSLSGSMRSPAFTSPSHSSTGPNSAASYGGQLSSLSPANLYSGSSPGWYFKTISYSIKYSISSIIRTSIIRTSIIRTPKVFIKIFFCKLVLEKPIEISVVCSNCCPI